MNGAAFYAGTTVHGAAITIRLGDVVAISEVLPAHIQNRLDEQEADKAEDIVNDRSDD